MNNPQITAAVANAMLTAGLSTPANGGVLSIFNGTQPSVGGGALNDNTLLASFTMPSPAFAVPTVGILTANAIGTSGAVASGTATWFRLYESDGQTALIDGTVGTTGCDLNLNTTTITEGDLLGVTQFTITQPLGA